jgi:hypothetical protein
MSRSIAILAAGLLAGCGHMRIFFLEEYRLEWAVEQKSLSVWSTRGPSNDMPATPLLVLRDSAELQRQGGTGCFEGFLNPRKIPLQWSNAPVNLEPVVLCPDPDAQPGEDGAFRLDLRTFSGKIEYRPFTARSSDPGEATVTGEGQITARVWLPNEPDPFATHPELLGAIFVTGVLQLRPDHVYQLQR